MSLFEIYGRPDAAPCRRFLRLVRMGKKFGRWRIQPGYTHLSIGGTLFRGTTAIFFSTRTGRFLSDKLEEFYERIPTGKGILKHSGVGEGANAAGDAAVEGGATVVTWETFVEFVAPVLLLDAARSGTRP